VIGGKSNRWSTNSLEIMLLSEQNEKGGKGEKIKKGMKNKIGKEN
jgi:hypothetical protein